MLLPTVSICPTTAWTAQPELTRSWTSSFSASRLTAASLPSQKERMGSVGSASVLAMRVLDSPKRGQGSRSDGPGPLGLDRGGRRWLLRVATNRVPASSSDDTVDELYYVVHSIVRDKERGSRVG
jgi:hypothetical protein